jgi:arginyl-tRNA synthetase
MERVIEELRSKNISKASEGAEVVEFKDMPPALLVKSNGATTYFTRDLATVKYRMEVLKPDLIIYEVGADQQLHFRQVFATAKMLEWEPKEGFEHVAHGLLRWKDGKFSTRKGATIHLEEVIDRAIEKAKDIANASQTNKIDSKGEREEMIKAVAIGAIKFNDLSQDPKKDIIFDWDKVMSLEGDSGPYLQYTYARALSVLGKSKIVEQKNVDQIPIIEASEIKELLAIFYRFEEKILEAAERYSPSVLAEYLLEVARNYNEFYAKQRIIGEADEVWKIFLTRTTASILKMGLDILGIETIERK